MKHIIYKIVLFILLVFCLLQDKVLAPDIEPDVVFSVGDTDYTVDRPIHFDKISINESWIMFDDFIFTVIEQNGHLDVVLSSIDKYHVSLNATGEAWLEVDGRKKHDLYVDGSGQFVISEYPEPSVIEVESKTVTVNQSFLLNITCYPKEPIKGWELKVSFDSSKMEANYVREGDFSSDRKSVV